MSSRPQLSRRGFTIEPEITARLLQAGERIFEVPVRYRARTNAEGKSCTSLDGLRVVGMLLRCRLMPPPAAPQARRSVSLQAVARRRLQRRRARRERVPR